MFFLLTEEVQGVPLTIKCAADARKIGDYAATLHSHGVYHADLHPLFESEIFIENWLMSFHPDFVRYKTDYIPTP